jgi:glycosyltransferase involved in cell wall biosynthesis
MNTHPADATVVITTKDRKGELRTAVQSAVEQTADPEVLVLDDGSTDGTAEMARGSVIFQSTTTQSFLLPAP